MQTDDLIIMVLDRHQMRLPLHRHMDILRDLVRETMTSVRAALAAEKARADKAEAEVARLRMLVKSADSIFRVCDVTNGVCHCGDNMDGHADAMSANHSPTDSGGWSVHLWQEDARAALENRDGK